MANEKNPSFSARQRWAIFFSVMVSIVAVIALVVMLNYLGARYYRRFKWTTEAAQTLSPQTIALIKSVTNAVSIVIYFDKQDPIYPDISSLLDEYHLRNPKISVASVDYNIDAAAAQQVKATNHLGSAEDKNLVIFTCNNHRFVVPAGKLADYAYQAVAGGKDNEYERHLEATEGERYFSAALLTVTSDKPRTAYFLAGHGEHDPEASGADGYQKFSQVLQQNDIIPEVIHLFGTNNIPADCSLLIIAGPRARIPKDEVDKVRAYLNRGGRLFVLFNYVTANTNIGLEPLLAEWNIAVGLNVVKDPDNDSSGITMVDKFSHYQPIVVPLIGSRLALINPRSIEILNNNIKDGPDTPKVDQLAFTGTNAIRSDHPLAPGAAIPLMVAAEKSGVKGVRQEGLSTAIVAVGDSTFLDNQVIDAAGNMDFAGFALNWLMDQTQLLQGIGPHPVKEYKLMLTAAESSSLRWIFLAAMPGGILFIGGLVWLRRRR